MLSAAASESVAVSIHPSQFPRAVEAALRDELARALKDGFSATELAQGKAGLLSFRQLSRSQDGALAGTLQTQRRAEPWWLRSAITALRLR